MNSFSGFKDSPAPASWLCWMGVTVNELHVNRSSSLKCLTAWRVSSPSLMQHRHVLSTSSVLVNTADKVCVSVISTNKTCRKHADQIEKVITSAGRDTVMRLWSACWLLEKKKGFLNVLCVALWLKKTVYLLTSFMCRNKTPQRRYRAKTQQRTFKF